MLKFYFKKKVSFMQLYILGQYLRILKRSFNKKMVWTQE